MVKKSVTTNLAFASIYILFTLLLISGVYVEYASSQPQTNGNVCNGLIGAAYGLCNAYCNSMKCNTDQQNASDTACGKVRNNFFKHSDLLYIPCDDPCQKEVMNDTDNECPCNFEAVPKNTACWGTTPNVVFTPCNFDECSLAIVRCLLAQDNRAVLGVVNMDPHGEYSCYITKFPPPCTYNVNYDYLTSDQYATCLCRVAQYATELSQVNDGIVVNPALQSGMSYSCGTFTIP